MKYVSIQKLVEHGHVAIKTGPFGTQLKASEYVSHGTPVLNVRNLGFATVNTEKLEMIGAETVERLSAHKLMTGDIVFGRKGAVERHGFISTDENGWMQGSDCIRLRVLTDAVNPRFLSYYFLTRRHKAFMISMCSHGTTMASLNQKIIEKIEVPLPERLIQDKIVGLLSIFDKRIAINQKINKNLEQQAQAIFKSWFIDFEPFDNRKPSDWSVSMLGNVSIMGAGGDKPRSVSQIKTDLYKFPIYSNGLSNEGLYGFTDKPKIIEESVTVSARGTIGFVCLRHIPYVPIVRLVTLIPKAEIISAKYLYLWLKQLHITGTGTTQQQLTVPDFQKTEILVPSQEIVTLFTATVEPIFEKIWANQNENEKLASLRDTLLPKLMSGELDVSNLDF